MTDQALHDWIFGNATAKALADVGNDAGCAAYVVANTTEAASLTVTYLGLAKLVDIAIVGRLMATLAVATDPVLQMINAAMQPSGPGVDIGNAKVSSGLQALPSPLTADDQTAILAAAQVPVNVKAADVSRVWLQYRPEGRIPS